MLNDRLLARQFIESTTEFVTKIHYILSYSIRFVGNKFSSLQLLIAKNSTGSRTGLLLKFPIHFSKTASSLVQKSIQIISSEILLRYQANNTKSRSN